MEEKVEQQKVLRCPTCFGVGKFRGRQCSNCRGLGTVLYKYGKVLFWRYDLTRFTLVYNRLTRIFNKIRLITVFILILICWVWAAYFAYQYFTVNSAQILFSLIPPSTQLLFWSGLLLACYAFYRGSVQRKRLMSVEQYDYDKISGGEKQLDSWQEVLGIPRRERRNISEAFTEEALAALDAAYRLADRSGDEEVKPVYLFVALLESNRIGNTFIRLGIGAKTISAEFDRLGLLPKGKIQKIPPRLGDELYQILFEAYEAAYNLHQNYVSVTELLIATVANSKLLDDILFDLGIDHQKLKNVVAWTRIRERLQRQYAALSHAGRFRSKHGMDRAMTAVATPFLNHLSDDITMKAQYGRTEACVARDAEIQQIFQIIEGGQNNVLLVGEYGAGKRTIVEGVAERMIEGDVPKRLQDKRLIQLSTSSLLSGATPAEAIQRLVQCLNEIARAGNVILFIHNLHELLGVSTGGDQSLDVASTLAEYLAGGNFLVLATTTVEAFAHDVSNSKLSSVFSHVDIKEMDQNQAIEVLESKAAYIEYKEKVFFAYDALEKAVEFSRRFLRDSPLPGSALELITEAAVHTRSKKGADSLVTSEQVSDVVVEKTHIPVNAISGNESEKLMNLEEELHRRVIGQDEAVTLVASALRRARAEIRSQSRPIANFLFLGPTGVGKTELAKTIAEVYFGGEQRMIRFDMSEYQDKSSIYRLIGEAGRKGTGILTEAVRRQPFALLLLDEIEKADKDILNLFLQVMDDGRLTDSTGRTVDFTNIIVIATSNAGTSYVQEQTKLGISQDMIKDRLLHGELKQYFRPEFLNRFDGIVLFDHLSQAAIKQITGLMLARIGKDLEKKGIKLEVTDEALNYFSALGFDPDFGARPLRRVLQEKVENQLAELLLSGNLPRHSTIRLEEGGRVTVAS
ncbi:MAG: ATP-dependent Clp protease ATP-binding subunit [Patescibacteria group bacterium]